MDNWHREYNPSNFLRNVEVEKLISKNVADSENESNTLGSPCVLCGSSLGPGLMLNNKKYLCKKCFHDLSFTTYPEVYEEKYRNYKRASKAHFEARSKIKEYISEQ